MNDKYKEYPTTIMRSPHDPENPYFQMKRDIAQDRELSYGARGLMVYLLSKPNNWQVKPSDLKQQCGRDKVYRLINELMDAGHMVRWKMWNTQTKRIEGYLYTIHETQVQETDFDLLPEKLYTANLHTGNQYITYKRDIQSTDKTKKDTPQKNCGGNPSEEKTIPQITMGDIEQTKHDAVHGTGCDCDTCTCDNGDTPPTMEEVDASIYGTRDNPVTPDAAIGALCEVPAPKLGHKCAVCHISVPYASLDAHYYVGSMWNTMTVVCTACQTWIDTLPPQPKTPPKPPSEHTAMKNALVAGMGLQVDDITMWGDYNKASKLLRKAGATPDDIPGLAAYTRLDAQRGKWTFKSPMAMASRWAQYKAQERAQAKPEQVDTDAPKPLDASDYIVKGVDYD